MIPVVLDEPELTTALAAVTDALDRVAERMMRKSPPEFVVHQHAYLKALQTKLSRAYREADI